MLFSEEKDCSPEEKALWDQYATITSSLNPALEKLSESYRLKVITPLVRRTWSQMPQRVQASQTDIIEASTCRLMYTMMQENELINLRGPKTTRSVDTAQWIQMAELNTRRTVGCWSQDKINSHQRDQIMPLAQAACLYTIREFCYEENLLPELKTMRAQQIPPPCEEHAMVACLLQRVAPAMGRSRRLAEPRLLLGRLEAIAARRTCAEFYALACARVLRLFLENEAVRDRLRTPEACDCWLPGLVRRAVTERLQWFGVDTDALPQFQSEDNTTLLSPFEVAPMSSVLECSALLLRVFSDSRTLSHALMELVLLESTSCGHPNRTQVWGAPGCWDKTHSAHSAQAHLQHFKRCQEKQNVAMAARCRLLQQEAAMLWTEVLKTTSDDTRPFWGEPRAREKPNHQRLGF